MYYATAIYIDQETTDFCQGMGFGGVTGVNDLHRFTTKEERDVFVESRDYASAITAKEARANYKEQFRYWKLQ